jgi:23S rRNA pseudouridine1911/1915/1917 synthase
VTTVLSRQFPGAKLHLAHRLDRETSGVLLLAKNPDGARALWRQFLARGIKKEYLALVSGRVLWKKKTVDLPLGREGGEIHVRQAGAADGQPALTEFQLVEAWPAGSLVRAMPATGRLHQIRVHLAHLGHPVLGDKLYTGDGSCYLKAVRRELSTGDLEGLGAPRQMLHARRISLRHPASGEAVAIEAPPPPDFEGALSRMRS